MTLQLSEVDFEQVADMPWRDYALCYKLGGDTLARR